MDREDILKMEAGPEMDVLVAEYVMEWAHWDFEGDYEGPFPMYIIGDSGTVWVYCEHGSNVNHFDPSIHIDAAWMALEQVAKLGKGWMLVGKSQAGSHIAYQRTGCADYDYGDWFAFGRTAPHAICRAALLATMEFDNAQ